MKEGKRKGEMERVEMDDGKKIGKKNYTIEMGGWTQWRKGTEHREQNVGYREE